MIRKLKMKHNFIWLALASVAKSKCLVESEIVAGIETGDVFSNL